MCSVSWQWNRPAEEGDGLSIFFNRDEAKSRSLGEPPRNIRSGPRKILCPLDPESGGTWFAANDAGLVVGLLNQYRCEHQGPKNSKSRGKLVLEIAHVTELADVHMTLLNAVLSDNYPPFTLLVWGEGEVRMWSWANSDLEFHSDPMPLITSSSWETDRVESWRKDFYEEKVIGEKWSRDQFHRHSITGDEVSSVCMMREKTQTVSLTTCRVSGSDVGMSYFPRGKDGNFGEGETSAMPINLLL